MRQVIINIIVILIMQNLFFIADSIGQSKEYSVKAALIEKFTHYIEWPNANGSETEREKFGVGIYGKSELAVSVDQLFRDLIINGKKVSVININSESDFSDIDILVIGDVSDVNLNNLQQRISQKPILTVSDVLELQANNIHVILYLTEEGNVKFKINKKALNSTGLFVSHLLLKYAEVIE